MPRAAWGWIGTLTLLAMGGCTSSSAFSCVDDASCEGVGPQARCEASGWCSFEDPSCDGDRRYGELAGDGLGGACVHPAGFTDGTGTGTGMGEASTSASSLDDTAGPSSDGTGLPEDEPWWDCEWAARRELVVEVPAIGETLEGVPLLVILDESRIDPSIMAPDGRDLRFVADDGTTVLPHQVEQWALSGLSWAWVRLPELPPGQTRLQMYYGNPSAPFVDGTAVWEGYAGVWHMDFELADSTGYSDTVQLMSETTLGQVALAQRFASYQDGVAVLAAESIGGLFAAGGTVSAMVRASGWGGNDAGFVVRRASASSGDDGWVLGLDGDRGALRFGRGFEVGRLTWYSPAGSIALHTWHHVAAVYDDDPSGAPLLYIDGVPQELEAVGEPMGVPAPDELNPEIHIASNFSAGTSWFHGIVDEVRLAPQPRSAAWMVVQAASLRDELVRYGPPSSAMCTGAG